MANVGRLLVVTVPTPVSRFPVVQPRLVVAVKLRCTVSPLVTQFVYGMLIAIGMDWPAVNVTVLGVTIGTPKQAGAAPM